MKTFLRTLAMASALTLGACNGGDGGDEVEETDVTETDPAETDPAETDPNGDSDLDCAAEPTAGECGTCCQTNLPSESEELLGYVVYACACADPTVACAADCTTAGNDVCSGEQPSPACQACVSAEMNNSRTCAQAGFQGCAGDPTCLPLIECLQECQG